MKQVYRHTGTLGWLWKAIAKSRLGIAGLLMIQMVLNGCVVVYALLFRDLVDRAIAGDRDGFFLSVGALVGMTAFQILLRACFRTLDEHTKAVAENSLKHRLFRTLLGRDYAAVTAVHTGEWMNRLTSDTTVVSNGVTQILPHLGGLVVRLVGAVAAIVLLEPTFGFLLVPGGLAVIGVTRLLRPWLKKMHIRIQESDGSLRVLLQERLDNLLITRAYSQQEAAAEQAAQRMDIHKDARMKRIAVSNIANVGFGAAINGLYLIGAFVCGNGILEGTLTFGTMTAVLELVSQLRAPLSGISGYLSQWHGMIASAERLMEPEGCRSDDAVADTAACLAYYQQEFSNLRVENLCFAYETEDRQVVMKDLNLQVRKGEFVALAGHSGCGKSTLLKLLLCLYRPDSGEIFLEGKDETRPLTPADRGLFAYVPQGNQLMSGTIRQILTFYREAEAEDEDRLWNALEVACARDFVEELTHGLDTELGEHGAGLSEGQLQRLAVARAIFSRRPILLLDESTSALDEATEKRLLDNLRTMTDRTVLVVTHRPRAMEICHRVLRLDGDTE